MKKLKIILLLCLALTLIGEFTNAQSNKWVMPPYIVDVTNNTLTSTLLPGHTATSSVAYADGIFDSSGNLLFYIENKIIYNHLGVSIGNTANTWYSEYDNYQIIPVPGNCLKYYVVSAEEIGYAAGDVFYSLIDISSGTAVVDPLHNHLSLGHTVTNYVQMATSKLMSNNERFLYIYNSGIAKFKVTSSGISFVSEILNGVAGLSNATPEKGEMEISPDNTKLAFYDWGNFGKIYVVSLNSSGNYLSHNIYNVSNLHANGFEFYNNELYVSTYNNSSAQDGINVIDLTAPATSSVHISSSAAYGLSEIELAANGNIIVRSSTHLAQINPVTKVLTQSIVMPNVTATGSSKNYDLPDQLDEEVNYANCCGAINLNLSDRTDCFGVSPLPHLYIGSQLGIFNLSQVTIKWYYNGVLTVGNPTSHPPHQFMVGTYGSVPKAGVYSVEVFYPYCSTPATASMTYNLINCGNNCEITPKFRIEEENCVFEFFNETTFGANTMINGYHWDFGDGTSSILENPSHTFNSKGNHTITLTVYGVDDEGNCCSETFSETIYIPEHCAPKACNIKAQMSLTSIGSNSLYFQSTSFTLGSSNIIAYEWTVDGIVVSNAASFAQQVNYGVNQICLTVFAVNSNGECCQETFCDEVEIQKEDERRFKMSDEEIVKKFSVSPNPSKGIFSIQLDNNDNSIATIEIFNSAGETIKNTSTILSEFVIDLSEYSNGIYFIKIEMDGNNYTKKLLLTK